MAFIAWDESGHRETYETDSAQDAAEAYVDGGNWGDKPTATVFHTIYVVDAEHPDDAPEHVRVTAHPEEPTCSGSADAEGDGPWRMLVGHVAGDDFKVVAPADEYDQSGGGLRVVEVYDEVRIGDLVRVRGDTARVVVGERPHDWHETGVRGYAGGILISERCRHCRRTKVTNTWAQDPSTGEQGLTSISYPEAS